MDNKLVLTRLDAGIKRLHQSSQGSQTLRPSKFCIALNRVD